MRYTALGPAASTSGAGGGGGGGAPAAKRPRLMRLASGDMGGGVEGGGGLRGFPSVESSWGEGEDEEVQELYRAAMGRMGSTLGATGESGLCL